MAKSGTKLIRRGALWTLGAVLTLAGCAFLWNIRNILLLLFLSLLLASGIDPVVNWLRRGPFNNGLAILAIYLAIFASLALLIYFIAPSVINELQILINNFSSQQSAKEAINNLDNKYLRDFALQIYQNAGDIASNFASVEQAFNLGLSAISSLFAIVTVFVVTFYWVTERAATKQLVLSFIKVDKQPAVNEVWQDIEAKLGAWVRGQLALMVFIGVLSGIGYTIMGLKFAFALGVLAGLAELIPLVGPYIQGGTAALVALTQSLTLVFVVIGFVILLQLLESNVLVPKIMQKAVGVNPLAAIVGVATGATLAGIVGALLAVPVVATLQVIYHFSWQLPHSRQLAEARNKAGGDEHHSEENGKPANNSENPPEAPIIKPATK